MKKFLNKRVFAATIAVIVGLGVSDTFAQKRKPTIRRKRATVAKRHVTPVYSVPSGTVVRVRLNSKLSSKTSVEGSTFRTTVTEPVYSSNGVVVIPVGSTVTGRVDNVVKARKGGKPGTVDVSFISVRLPNGVSRSINGTLTDLDTKDGKSDNEGTAAGDKMSHRKLIFIGGGGAGGALIGAAVGGGKGALIGGIIGGIGGLITETQTKGEDVDVKSGTEFGVYLNQSVTLPRFVEGTQRP
jgi:hypothetical protein